MNCHQGGDARVLQPGKSYLDFRPGQWLIETVAIFKIPPQPGEQKDSDLLEHDSAMKISHCFRESRAKLSCLTCHDPHVQPTSTEADFHSGVRSEEHTSELQSQSNLVCRLLLEKKKKKKKR